MLSNKQESKHQWYLKNRSRLLEKAIDTERALTEDSIRVFDQAWLEFKASCKA